MKFSLSTLSLFLVTTVAAVAFSDESFPDVIDLPVGWFPEGIDIGRGTGVYVGSIKTGRIWKGDLRDGTGSVFGGRQS